MLAMVCGSDEGDCSSSDASACSMLHLFKEGGAKKVDAPMKSADTNTSGKGAKGPARAPVTANDFMHIAFCYSLAS